MLNGIFFSLTDSFRNFSCLTNTSANMSVAVTNNILIDKDTGEGICVIDLDTVMPGLSINDFGDSIRFGANTAAEDEQDVSKVSLSLPLFESYTKGLLAGCAGSLTRAEVEMLPMGAKLMTLECGISTIRETHLMNVFRLFMMMFNGLKNCYRLIMRISLPMQPPPLSMAKTRKRMNILFSCRFSRKILSSCIFCIMR